MKVTTSKLQNSFGKYLSLVMEGEEVFVVKNNKTVARLSGLSQISYGLNESGSKPVMKDGATAYNTSKKVSLKEFEENFCNDETDLRYELIGGVVYALASPSFLHQRTLTKILWSFMNWFEDKSCTPLVAPFDTRLSNGAENFLDDPNVVQPDLLVICDQDKVDDKGKYHGVPSLVVEILSPSTKGKDMFVKGTLYMNSGVKEYWIVDTKMKKISVYRFEDRQVVDNIEFFGSDMAKSFVFEGLEVAVDEIVRL